MRERARKSGRPQAPFGPSVDSLCHPWFTTTNLSYRFPIFETSATALCGTTGIILYYIMLYYIILYHIILYYIYIHRYMYIEIDVYFSFQCSHLINLDLVLHWFHHTHPPIKRFIWWAPGEQRQALLRQALLRGLGARAWPWFAARMTWPRPKNGAQQLAATWMIRNGGLPTMFRQFFLPWIWL